jgi:hypothetical protein
MARSKENRDTEGGVMFCPKCGSNQDHSKKFCTNCGVNLHLISQALTGQIPQSIYVPTAPNPLELERRRQLARGYKFTIIGSGLIASSFIKFLFFSGFFGFWEGFWSIIGFIFLSVGVPKIISYGSPLTGESIGGSGQIRRSDGQRFFSPVQDHDRPVRVTNELEIPQHPRPSVVEDETLHLPERAKRATRKFQ